MTTLLVVLVWALIALSTIVHAWLPDPVEIDKTSYCKVCGKLVRHLEDSIVNVYTSPSNGSPPSRPKVSDLQRLLRDACRDASFKRRGLEACHHIVRRNTNRIVHAAFDALFDSEQKQSASLWRNPVIAPDPKRTLFQLVCSAGLAYTTCPPATVDVFILPDEELWRLTDDELLDQKRRREAMRRGTIADIADPIADAVAANAASVAAVAAVNDDDAAAAAAAAAAATTTVTDADDEMHVDNFSASNAPVPPAAPRPKPRWAERHEYATAVDEVVDFDDDDSDELALEHHEDSDAMNKVFASANVIHYRDEL